MADFEAPSFSLGLDLDADTEPRSPTVDHPEPLLAPDSSASFGATKDGEDELGPEQEVMDSDPDTRPEPTRVLKRLRRAGDKSSATKKESEKPLAWNDGDDEIEEFCSSQENKDVDSSTQNHSVCGSSKISLKGLGVLTTQSSGQCSSRKREQASDAPASASLEARHGGLTFPWLTISPLRRFKLLDSDSDGSEGPSDCEDKSKGAHKLDPPSKEQQSTVSDNKRKASVVTPQNEDLWKDFTPINTSHIPTPAFDEVFKEYFQSVKDMNAAQKLENQKFEELLNLDDPLPPAHCYFFHDDPRIQKLVRTRLPFFSPLHMVKNRGNQQRNVSVIDYMSQFSNEESSKQRGSQKGGGKNCSTSRRNKSKKSNAEETASEGWVDLKSGAAIPRNAGKRRVHASDQPAGHWYTSPEGRKVYVSRSGQELSGQMAYRHYRKESVAGFRKSKKKSNGKKKK
ncbi:uncharacterized protein LOC110418898 [Herrania umbratica]|uniref:Uncharacterized protein LOC110418898 n=1 Tax=Herrania umbratica TaxID=108875 RepID=A0A6J1AJM5_9ROSI|nr:uncharacterized protein LOC110418898 [Herrania umbratica]